MASVLLGNPAASGPQIIVSGNPWSGQTMWFPQGGVQFRLDKNASGNCYIGLSGNMTVTSGGMFLSGPALTDGMQLTPGDAYWIPRLKFPYSGTFNIYGMVDSAGSGQARLYFEVF